MVLRPSSPLPYRKGHKARLTMLLWVCRTVSKVTTVGSMAGMPHVGSTTASTQRSPVAKWTWLHEVQSGGAPMACNSLMTVGQGTFFEGMEVEYPSQDPRRFQSSTPAS